MKLEKPKIKILLVLIMSLAPFFSFAQVGDSLCSKSGYTIATINGVLTDDDGAKDNMIALSKKVGFEWGNQVIDYQYLLNPSHLGGLGDVFTSIYQKAFENETVMDYDLVEMLNSASKKVKTQKVLLVAHSQGNFYANSFYDVVTKKQVGGVPAQSISVYGIATPASRVAGNGRWLTSKTDKVIATVVGDVPFKTIMIPNINIDLQPGDDFWGHDFEKVYIHYQSNRIVEDIKASLDGLSKNTVQDENAPCMSTPKMTIAHQIAKADLAYLDTVVSLDKKAVVGIASTGATVAIGAYNLTESFANLAFNAEVALAKWSFNTSVAFAVWTYDTTTGIAKFVGNTAVGLASTAYNSVVETLTNKSIVANNQASVILATQPAQKSNSVLVNKNQMTVVAVPVNQPQPLSAPAQSQPQTVFVFEPKVQTGANAPKLVFVGAFGGGGGNGATAEPSPQQVLGIQTSVSGDDEAKSGGETADTVGTAMAVPTVSAPQCAQTLATDGCLLATTTVRFEWPIVEGADHYLINKNGEYSTTTENNFDARIKDFSDYTFEVIAVDADGNISATSTQKVSVATIPIAINEIAWMGTLASASDEWFEIKNNTAHTVDLSQWELNAKDGTPHVKLTGVIKPREYLVFERTDNTTITDVKAHQIYTGALGNTGEQLNLSYASTTFDQTPDGKWTAGENSTTTRKTMERFSSRESGADPSNWGTNLGYIKNGIDADGNPIEGTPGAQNSVSTLINKGQDIINDFTLTADEEKYVVADDWVHVQASSTLTIEPGVKIVFYGHSGIYVEGALNIEGTKEKPIKLSSSEEGVVSGGITMRQTNQATSTINYANIINTKGIDIYGASTTLKISNTNFIGNAIAVEAYSGASVSIASSTVLDTFYNDAFGVYSASKMAISSTTIDGVSDGSGIGVYDGTLYISSSTIRNVSDSGMYLWHATSTISNVNIENGGWDGIDVNGGTANIINTNVSGFTDGIGISVYSEPNTVTITGGEITGNEIGVATGALDTTQTNVFAHDNGTSDADNVIVW